MRKNSLSLKFTSLIKVTCAFFMACMHLNTYARENKNSIPVNKPLKHNAKRPNIVFLLADDHQAMALGCMGNSEIRTPNIDNLAASGVLFKRCYATSPLCMASRATVMTGMYEYKNGCNFKTGNISIELWENGSYPTMLHKAGYRTAFAGKWGINTEKELQQIAKDFDKWGGLKGGQGLYQTIKNPTMVAYGKKYPHVTRALGAFGQDFIRESVAAGEPFCLSLSFKAPHKPHDIIDSEDQKLYNNMTFSEPAGFEDEGLKRLPIQAKLGRQYIQREEWDKEHFQEHRKSYYQLISGVDAAIGMVIKELEKQGVADNTVIIYTADNGYFCGAHGLQGKVLPYEHASRIPLIIYDPRLPETCRGTKARGLTANLDFAPTMLDLAGLKIPEEMDGKSLIPVLQNSDCRVRSELGLVQNWDWGERDVTKALAVVTEEHKYILWCYADENVPVAEELFSLKKDANELQNVASNPEMSVVLNTMRKKYDTFQKHWADNCVDGPFYKRTARILDRNIPWQKKDYIIKSNKPRENLYEVYEELTGADYPIKKKD